MEFLLSLMTVYGISAIVTISKLFEPLRDFSEKHSPNFWYHLTSCMQCLPFWIGIIVSYTLGTPYKVEHDQFPDFINTFLTYLFCGALFSGTTLLIHTVFINLKGNKWIEKQKAEKARKIKKGIIPENQ